MSAGEDLVVQTEAVPEWTLADRLRKALEHANVSGPEMAEYLEVHRNTVSNWIYGHARPPASAVKLWAMRCGVPYEWLSGQSSYIRSGIHEDSRPGYHPVDSELAAGMKPISHLVPLVRPADAARIRGAAR